MTLKARNVALLALNTLLIAITGAAGVLTLPYVGSVADVPVDGPGSLYGISFSGVPRVPLATVLGSAVAVLIAAGGALGLRRFFRRSISPILFFVGLSLVFHGFTAIRILQVPLFLEGFGLRMSLVLSRVVFFFYFSSVLSLFVASSYAAGSVNPRLWSVSAFVVTVGLFLAYTAPLDATNFTDAFVHAFQPRVNLQIFTAIVSLLSMLNFIRYASDNEDAAGWSVIGAAAALVAGRELMMFLGSAPAQLVGAVLLVLGLVSFIRSSYSVYLWG
ncbi:MAG: hypothetical protein ACLFM0_08175 [Spirochaetales bacterium]